MNIKSGYKLDHYRKVVVALAEEGYTETAQDMSDLIIEITYLQKELSKLKGETK